MSKMNMEITFAYKLYAVPALHGGPVELIASALKTIAISVVNKLLVSD